MWQGLGYNRRAVALLNAAKLIVRDFEAGIPDDTEALKKLPGIGPATAASIAAFAFNRPTVFLETNIRTVLIHHFFNDQQHIDDAMLLLLAEAVLDRRNPRKWYSALMDYGSMLKKEVGNLARKSSGYKKQTPFAGSRRQARGKILRYLLRHPPGSVGMLADKLSLEADTAQELLGDLTREGLLKRTGSMYRVAG
jgi:A/G-specific adenine glycosylase